MARNSSYYADLLVNEESPEKIQLYTRFYENAVKKEEMELEMLSTLSPEAQVEFFKIQREKIGIADFSQQKPQSIPPLSTATRNQRANIKVDGTLRIPNFGQEFCSSNFKFAWETHSSEVWKPCFVKITSVQEVTNVEILRSRLEDVDFEQSHLVDAKPWRTNNILRAGVVVPRYLGVLSEFTQRRFKVGTEMIYKHVVQISIALRVLHGHNLVHMDVKPSNILLDQNCDAFLGDFGSITQTRDQISSYTPAFTISEVPYEAAHPHHDWISLLLTALFMMDKLVITETPQLLEKVLEAIERLRGDSDQCHMLVFSIFDTEVRKGLISKYNP